MTLDELARLKSLCDKATPGPWEVSHTVGKDKGWFDVGPCKIFWSTPPETWQPYHDARWLTTARSALPALIAEVERLREAERTAFRRGQEVMQEKCYAQVSNWDEAQRIKHLEITDD